jgi:polyphenol oxidase
MIHGDLLRSTLLEREGIRHEFGQRSSLSAPTEVATARQVHGVVAFWPVAPGPHLVEADVLIARAGVSVGVVTADCVPVLLASPRTRFAAAVHAGWRGTLAGAVGVALAELRSAGAADDLVFAIGPAIGPCCYEVSADLAERFVERFGRRVVANAAGRTTLDLQEANALELARLGVAVSRIDVLRECTRCAKDQGGHRFHSFRRDGKAAGRQISYVQSSP